MPKQYSKVNIEISNICNLQCSFCPEVEREKGMMSVELFEKIIHELKPYTKLVALHLMGDPLVHPKLNEFVEICSSNDMKIFFVTNGLLLNEKESKILLHPIFRQVNFSLHSFADNFPDKDPSEYLNRIFKFTEKAFELRSNLFINYRLWNINSRHGKKEDNFNALKMIEGFFKVSLPRSTDPKVQKNFIVKNRLSLHFDTEFDWPKIDLPILGTTGTCQGLSSHFGILMDGTVVPCCLDKEGDIALGNISKTPLSDILNDTRPQTILQGFRNKKLVEDLCQRCQYIERFA